MEDLNKSQLILLAILVSFVTSIATGIVTVTLMNETPLTVTQTINRIVERTVEKVVPGETQTVIKEVPVIVTEEELLVKVINQSKPAMVRIGKTDSTFIGSGFLVGDELTIATSQNIFTSSSETYQVTLYNGLTVLARVAERSESSKLVILKIQADDLAEAIEALDEDKSLPLVSILSFSTSTPEAGQTALALGSGDSDAGSVSVGIVASVSNDSQFGGEVVRTNAVSAANIGGPLLNISGQVVGVNSAATKAVSSSLLKQLIDQAQ